MGFSAQIIQWYEIHHRRLPWRETKDPYKIWVSEIILQQTRVEQGLDYYHRFISRFPNILALAEADEEEVLKLWQGLGYYSRARNMHHAARQVMKDHRGKFPKDYQKILSLKGVGEYSASAVASFAYGLPYPVVDGNVIRFVTRFSGITDPVKSSNTRNRIKEILELELDRERPGIFNQAIMEFGARQCVPRKPDCLGCPLQSSCVAWNTGNVDKIPYKTKNSPPRNRFFHYLVFMFMENGQVFTLLDKRMSEDIWKNLFQFPLIEADRLLAWQEIENHPDWKEIITSSGGKLIPEPAEFTHLLSHRRITARSFKVMCSSSPEGFTKVAWSDLERYPVSRLMEKVISEANITFA